MEYLQKKSQIEKFKIFFFLLFLFLKSGKKKGKNSSPKREKTREKIRKYKGFLLFTLSLLLLFFFLLERGKRENFLFSPFSFLLLFFLLERESSKKGRGEGNEERKKDLVSKQTRSLNIFTIFFYPSKARIKICASLRLNDICENIV